MSSSEAEAAACDAESENDGVGTGHQRDRKSNAKRRTKTGCLTCRKRRIKCGEERPICRNCIKSKRECAGYNPPPTYKQTSGQPAIETPRLDVNPQPDQFVSYDARHPLPSYARPATFRSEQFQGMYTTPYMLAEQDPVSTGLMQPYQNSRADPYASWSATTDYSQTLSGHLPSSVVPYGFPLGRIGRTDFGSIFPHASASLEATHGNSSEGLTSTLEPKHLHPSLAQREARLQSMAFAFDEQYEDPDDPFDIVDGALDQIGDFPATQDAQIISAGIAPHERQSKDAANSYNEQGFTMLKARYPECPLLEATCQPIFQHFLNVTGPCMSIFDRTKVRMESGLRTMPWTHELPKMALTHPALAYAILSVGALHLAHLYNNKDDVAVDYFTRALCCVKPLLEKQQTRGHVSTLATILLLAYYEVMAGDHSRWSLHLSGAAKLVMENDFATTVRIVQTMRRQATSSWGKRTWGISGVAMQDQENDMYESLLDDEEWDIDQHLIGSFMGFEVDYATQVQVNVTPNQLPSLSAKQFAETRLLVELYWWYCKQDLFQCMLSGDGPTLSYSKWRFCPPRGRIGIAEKAYASVDHLWLILGRLTEFGYRDRKRKLRVVAANGGEWIPPSGFLSHPPGQPRAEKAEIEHQESRKKSPTSPLHSFRQKAPPVANEGRTRSAKSANVGPVPIPTLPMYGMLPPSIGPISMPSSFKAVEAELQRGSDISPSEEDIPSSPDLDADLQSALKEHAAISAALDLFSRLLGRGFQAMEDTETVATPFGPAARYADPTIASLWIFYHVARIVCRRLHPHSPPAAMVSAAVNSSFTQEHAQEIGRIFGGLFVTHDLLSGAGQLDHLNTSAIMDSSLGLLFAAVQYHVPSQRIWTIDKLNHLAAFTGIASSAAIASACEATWSKLGEAGKGPPYHRIAKQDHDDIRIASKTPTADSMAAQRAVGSSAEKEHESRFVHHDRTLIGRHSSTRAYWAIGLLSVEDDLKAMDLQEKEL